MSFENKYPYTDFHELNLDWFLQEFKKLLNEWADLAANNAEFKQTMTERFGTLSDTVHEFTTFVTNYFDNLDVQQEINNKLNDMLEDGTLSELLKPYFNAFTVEINARMRNQDDKIAVLEGRMDTFVHLPNGSTTGDAELQDIRVGYDGVTYPTAGDAVRGQIGDLSAMQYISFNKIASFTTGFFYTLSPQQGLSIDEPDNVWTRTITNFIDYLPKSASYIIAHAPSADKRAFIVEFTERPNYTHNTSNSDKWVEFVQSEVGGSCTMKINREHYYVVQTNVKADSLEGSDFYAGCICSAGDTLPLLGKKLSVMGDSISTYHTIIPSGYPSFYPRGDVSAVFNLWWYKVCNMTGMVEDVINAYSGSCVAIKAGQTECSSDERTSNMGSPDVIICCCGLNDFFNQIPLGNYDGTQDISTNPDRTKFKEAYASMLYKMQTNYPNAKIYCCTITQHKHTGYETIDNNMQTVVNGAGVKLIDYNNAIRDIAKMFGCSIIENESCGLDLVNIDNMTVDASPNAIHPNRAGHILMAKQVVNDIIK